MNSTSLRKSALPDHSLILERIMIINKIYVFWSGDWAVQYAMGKKPLKNGHNNEMEGLPHFTRKSDNYL